MAICTLAGTGGCVSTSETIYPASWPVIETVQHTDCDHLAGRFKSVPDLVTPTDRGHARLTYWLAGSNWEIRTQAFAAVELEVHDGQLAVRTYSPGIDGGADVPIENWHCENGRLVGTPPMSIQSEGHGALHVAGQVVLERAVDRALVVHVHSRESGLSMIVPFRESKEYWFVYREAD